MTCCETTWIFQQAQNPRGELQGNKSACKAQHRHTSLCYAEAMHLWLLPKA